MKVLVVGGAGYIGSHVVRALRQRGHQPLIYDNLSTGHERLARGFDLRVADLSDTATLSKSLKGCDAVMHFAAHAYVGESVQNPRKYFYNNVQNGLQLLHAMLDTGVLRIIFSSTCAVYGAPDKVPITEDMPRLPVNPYGVTKLTFEQALEAYESAYGLRFAALRYFNAAGADSAGEIGELHAPETHLIPVIFRAITGHGPGLEVFGEDYPTPDGTCIRDYIHVSDLAEAHVLALEFLESSPRLAVNLGTGRGYSVKEVIAAVEEVTGRRVPRSVGTRRVGDPPVLVSNPTRAQQLLDWQAKFSLREMVITGWRWHQSAIAAGVVP